ncbi:hypothetical protein ACETAC_01420 [Aceticella autotrophica]|uniref:Uncharacterized protein n=1 Tax=Aceticella autotrophica TaxID=2755338 RepID=A0A975AWB4_9THEO|nr:hypothetical protein [Aceticella autotrophica]QSZ27603.1 hypothetical protein ACETAC_01420 [Aceticella autotrophica]
MKKRIFLLTVFVLMLLTNMSYADTLLNWTDPTGYPTPLHYSGREYTRSHYTEYYLSEGAGYQFIGSDYSPVFEPPFDILGKSAGGYTAYEAKENCDDRLGSIFDSLGVIYDNGYWIVSPAYWNSQGWNEIFKPTTPDSNSECIFDVPVTTGIDTSGISKGLYTINNPKCFINGPGFEAGGYDGNTGYHWKASGQNAPIQLTKSYASGLFKQSTTTEAKIYFNYLYNIAVTRLDDNGNGNWTAYVFNYTPYNAKDVHLRAYIVQDGEYTLAAETTTDIGPYAVGDGSGGFLQPAYRPHFGEGVSSAQEGLTEMIKWNFNARAAAGSSSYKILVTADISLDQNGNPTGEPLKTDAAYGGHSYPSGYFAPNGKSEVAPDTQYVRSGLNVSDGLSDNYIFSDQKQPPSSTPASNDIPIPPKDLAVTDVSVTDEGNNVANVKSTFKSTFNVGGYANITLYEVNTDLNYPPTVIKSDNIFLPPNGTVVKDWGDIGMGEDSYKLIVSIDYDYNGSGDWKNDSNWYPEQFAGNDGKMYTEATYTNNKAEGSFKGQFIRPTYITNSEIQSAYYPPVKYTETPIYKTETEDVYGWKKVPYIKEQAVDKKPRIRLIQ